MAATDRRCGAPQTLKFDPGVESSDRELVVTRIFDAPRELVFEALTKPEHLMKWWGPHGCAVISCKADLRAGGAWSISMQSPRVLPQFAGRYPINSETKRALPQQHQSSRDDAADEQEWIVERQRGIYQEVVRPERLVFTYAFEDDAGRPLHQTTVTISFADEGGRTRLTLRQTLFESVTARDDHVLGWSEALEHLAEHLAHVQYGQTENTHCHGLLIRRENS
jgi:uncharacterized protein YndB with AHSA1/START domain